MYDIITTGARKNSKFYKSTSFKSTSGFRAVSIHPGDLCGRRMFYYLKDILGEIL